MKKRVAQLSHQLITITKASPLIVSLAIVGIVFSSAYILLANPRDLGDAPQGFSSNPYYVGICLSSTNRTGQNCDPVLRGEPCTKLNGCPGVCPSGEVCVESYGRCENDFSLCHPGNGDDIPPIACGPTAACQGTCSHDGSTCDTSRPTESCGPGNECFLFNSISDLDNCPGGPNGLTCRDEFGVQISCYNPQQEDDNLDLVGNICDSCNDSGAFGVFSLEDVNDWGKVCLNDPVGVHSTGEVRLEDRRSCRFSEDCPVFGADYRCSDNLNHGDCSAPAASLGDACGSDGVCEPRLICSSGGNNCVFGANVGNACGPGLSGVCGQACSFVCSNDLTQPCTSDSDCGQAGTCGGGFVTASQISVNTIACKAGSFQPCTTTTRGGTTCKDPREYCEVNLVPGEPTNGLCKRGSNQRCQDNRFLCDQLDQYPQYCDSDEGGARGDACRTEDYCNDIDGGLRLHKRVSPTPFMWLPRSDYDTNEGATDAIARIRLIDELGRAIPPENTRMAIFTQGLGDDPSRIQVDLENELVWIGNRKSDDVTLLNTADGTSAWDRPGFEPSWRCPGPQGPHGIAINSEGTAYVTGWGRFNENPLDSRLFLFPSTGINSRSNCPTAAIAYPSTDDQPFNGFGAAVDADNMMWISGGQAGAIYLINMTTLELKATFDPSSICENPLAQGFDPNKSFDKQGVSDGITVDQFGDMWATCFGNLDSPRMTGALSDEHVAYNLANTAGQSTVTRFEGECSGDRDYKCTIEPTCDFSGQCSGGASCMRDGQCPSGETCDPDGIGDAPGLGCNPTLAATCFDTNSIAHACPAIAQTCEELNIGSCLPRRGGYAADRLIRISRNEVLDCQADSDCLIGDYNSGGVMPAGACQAGLCQWVMQGVPVAPTSRDDSTTAYDGSGGDYTINGVSTAACSYNVFHGQGSGAASCEGNVNNSDKSRNLCQISACAQGRCLGSSDAGKQCDTNSDCAAGVCMGSCLWDVTGVDADGDGLTACLLINEQENICSSTRASCTTEVGTNCGPPDNPGYCIFDSPTCKNPSPDWYNDGQCIDHGIVSNGRGITIDLQNNIWLADDKSFAQKLEYPYYRDLGNCVGGREQKVCEFPGGSRAGLCQQTGFYCDATNLCTNVGDFCVPVSCQTNDDCDFQKKYRVGDNPIGIAVDSFNRVWAVNLAGGRPEADGENSLTAPGKEINLTIDLEEGRLDITPGKPGSVTVLDAGTGEIVANYTVQGTPDAYSDFAGLQRGLVVRSGFWESTFDAGRVDTFWDRLSYIATIFHPNRQSLTIQAKASDSIDDLESKDWQRTVINSSNGEAGLDLGVAGRWLTIRITFRTSEVGSSPLVNNVAIKYGRCSNVECTPGSSRECGEQRGVCLGTMESCDTFGQWQGCSTQGYIDNSGGTYQSTFESACTDNLDNDCDGNEDGLDFDCKGFVSAEICTDGVDNDGDSAIDCADSDCFASPSCTGGLISYYLNSDDDGFFSSSVSGTCSGTGCQPIGSATTPGLDCVDTNDRIFPFNTENPNCDCDFSDGIDRGVPEICDGQDNNCNGVVDESCSGECSFGEPDITCASLGYVGVCAVGSAVCSLAGIWDQSDCLAPRLYYRSD